MPHLRLLACLAMPSMQSLTGTRRPVNKWLLSSGSSLCRSRTLEAAEWEQTPPHTSSSYRDSKRQSVRLSCREAEISGALRRGLLNLGLTCGPSFRLGSPRRRSSEACGPGLLRIQGFKDSRNFIVIPAHIFMV